jgi:hypothetical protein
MTFRVKQLANNEFEISFVPQVPRLPVSEEPPVELEPKPSLAAAKIAAVKLREFLAGVERRTSAECIEHLKAGGFDLTKLNPAIVKKMAGVTFELREGKCWWVLGPQVEPRAAVARF